MSKTKYEIKGDNFIINKKLTYSELEGSDPSIHGLLFNARFIQGIFEDINIQNANIFDRFNKVFDKNTNTDELVQELPQWYEKGLRAITVGLQGGGPVYTFKDCGLIDTNAFSKDGRTIEEGHKKRLLKIIDQCDKLGMLVIVSCLYEGQSNLLNNEFSLINSVRSVCEFLSKTEYTNIIIEVANEQDVGKFDTHPMIYNPKSMACLIELAKEWSNNKFAVGCSSCGGKFSPDIVKASDVVLIHGNGQTREEFHRFITNVKQHSDGKPIVCNEDSQKISQLQVCKDMHISWGYYNNFTKQEPPIDWTITKGEDEYFLIRLNDLIYNKKFAKNRIYLQGFEPYLNIDNKFFPRIAALYPEMINYVEFFENDVLIDRQYEDPFMYKSLTTWSQLPYTPSQEKIIFKAMVYLIDGSINEIYKEISLS